MYHLFNQTRTPLILQILSYLLSLFILAAIALSSVYMDIPIYKFMRDPSSITNVSPFIGIISNFGVLLWCTSAAICLFSWIILSHRSYETEFSKFILCSGLMTVLLLIDDFFRLHEYIFPKFLGLPEKIVIMGYGTLILFGLIKFRKCILKTEFLILLAAIGFFGLSLIVDLFQNDIEQLVGQWRILFEDGFKLLGIVSWLGYFLRSCYIEFGRNLRDSN